MSECGQKAVLVVTQTAVGTSTEVARRRVELCCRLPSGHGESHYDSQQNERWDAPVGKSTMLLRHEDEDGEPIKG